MAVVYVCCGVKPVWLLLRVPLSVSVAARRLARMPVNIFVMACYIVSGLRLSISLPFSLFLMMKVMIALDGGMLPVCRAPG